MTERNVAADREVAHAREALELACARREAAHQRLELSELGARPEDLERAEAEVRAAQAGLAAARAAFDKTFIHSPIDGMVVYRYRQTGEAVFAGASQPILTVGDRSRLYIRVDVDETDVARVYNGQHVFATTRAYEGRRFPGRVVHIEPTLGRKNFRTNLPTEKIDTRIQEIVVELDEADEIPLGLQMVVWFLKPRASEALDKVSNTRDNRFDDSPASCWAGTSPGLEGKRGPKRVSSAKRGTFSADPTEGGLGVGPQDASRHGGRTSPFGAGRGHGREDQIPAGACCSIRSTSLRISNGFLRK